MIPPQLPHKDTLDTMQRPEVPQWGSPETTTTLNLSDSSSGSSGNSEDDLNRSSAALLRPASIKDTKKKSIKNKLFRFTRSFRRGSVYKKEKPAPSEILLQQNHNVRSSQHTFSCCTRICNVLFAFLSQTNSYTISLSSQSNDDEKSLNASFASYKPPGEIDLLLHQQSIVEHSTNVDTPEIDAFKIVGIDYSNNELVDLQPMELFQEVNDTFNFATAVDQQRKKDDDDDDGTTALATTTTPITPTTTLVNK